MILHTVNKSPLGNHCLASCLRVAAANDAVLLIEDAVYALLPGLQYDEDLKSKLANRKLYALAPDIEARGLSQRIPDTAAIELVDFAGFVKLSTECDKVVSWY